MIVQLEITGYMRGPVGQKVDFQVGVCMKAATDEAAHDHIDAELLQHLPLEASLRGLALFDFPAGEFPFIRQAIPAFAAGDEDPAVFFKDGGRDGDSSQI